MCELIDIEINIDMVVCVIERLSPIYRYGCLCDRETVTYIEIDMGVCVIERLSPI